MSKFAPDLRGALRSDRIQGHGRRPTLYECAKLRGSRALVGLVGLCLRGSRALRGLFVGSEKKFVGCSWVQKKSSWVL